MKRLLLPLLAAIALPTAVNAESHWLIINLGNNNGTITSLEKIEMPSAEACVIEGRKWENSPTQGYESKRRRFHCVIGK